MDVSVYGNSIPYDNWNIKVPSLAGPLQTLSHTTCASASVLQPSHNKKTVSEMKYVNWS